MLSMSTLQTLLPGGSPQRARPILPCRRWDMPSRAPSILPKNAVGGSQWAWHVTKPCLPSYAGGPPRSPRTPCRPGARIPAAAWRRRSPTPGAAGQGVASRAVEQKNTWYPIPHVPWQWTGMQERGSLGAGMHQGAGVSRLAL